MLIAQTGGMYSVIRLITVLLLFFFVLGITYFTSRYIAGYQKKHMGSSNIEVLEAARIMPGTVLEIVRVADKYLVIAIAKDKVTMLTELDPDAIMHGATPESFGDILGKAALHFRKKDADAGEENEEEAEGEE